MLGVLRNNKCLRLVLYNNLLDEVNSIRKIHFLCMSYIVCIMQQRGTCIQRYTIYLATVNITALEL